MIGVWNEGGMMASADEKPWAVDTTSRVYGLQVISLKRVYVLPWSQFLYAEGTSEEVQAFFSTHECVMVQGSGLDSLLADFASQQITGIGGACAWGQVHKLCWPAHCGIAGAPG